ncbi:hypothetical protein AVEN_24758-1 [Araneus ventricosus]|uniref:Secreted protein n=1 Tax=Araneus ventricosus TaxID=182803 RepID=A0A4Y2VSH8_ARAVE|nr:hypothetical protein AVEN_24758-1 [Araneus ventricosus]
MKFSVHIQPAWIRFFASLLLMRCASTQRPCSEQRFCLSTSDGRGLFPHPPASVFTFWTWIHSRCLLCGLGAAALTSYLSSARGSVVTVHYTYFSGVCSLERTFPLDYVCVVIP